MLLRKPFFLHFRKRERWNDFATEDVIINNEIAKGEHFSPVEEELEKKWLNEEIRKGVNQLPPFYKEVFILRYFYDLKQVEIAEALNINVGTVKSRLHRGKNHLKEQFLQEEKGLLKEGNI